MTFHKTITVCNPQHHPQNEFILPGQVLGSIEQRYQEIVLVLGKMVVWGMIGVVGVFVGGLPETQMMKHDNWILQSLPDGYLHRYVSVWWGGAVTVVFIQYFIIGQTVRAYRSLCSLLSHY